MSRPRKRPPVRAADQLRRLEEVQRALTPRVRKEDAACCRAHRDAFGRLPIGFCGPDCERRPPPRTG